AGGGGARGEILESLAAEAPTGVDLADIPPGATALDGRDVIRTAGITVRAERIGDATAQARAIVTAAGGTTFSEQAAFGSRSDAVLEFKVPPDQFRAVLGRLGDLGRTRELYVSTEDVTEQVVDLESRLASATASRNRLQGLFGEAEDVGEIVALETALAQREAEVESLEGQLRVVRAQVDLATITLTITKLVAGPAEGESASGFLGGLERGWDAMVGAATAGATALGAALPFLALGGLVLGFVFIIRRRHPAPPGFGVTSGE
ncbi:MAG TPA: DUF4349 domain-containing protein, partial [Acidimicrobiia bacterium]|nr:DUF4349 domain-containing protein [Acidimicrobiia bacterium]